MTASCAGWEMAATMGILFPQVVQISGSVRHTLEMSRTQLRLRDRLNSFSSSWWTGRAIEALLARGIGEGAGRDVPSRGWIAGVGFPRGGGRSTGGLWIQPNFFMRVVETAPLERIVTS
ncbi:MAG: hypothetical protein HY717_10570 [Planctomycetes bacterium]|nr:hypothetical protein [Planctomycetota bacterium]